MAMKEDLIGIVGAKNVSDDAEQLKPYSKDCSVNEPKMPSYVVKPKNAEEVQKVIILANERKLPVVPCSSGIHFNGDTIPVKGGIVLDLSGMNRILAIDDRNRMARIEAGVTWEQLQPELAKHDMMSIRQEQQERPRGRARKTKKRRMCPFLSLARIPALAWNG